MITCENTMIEILYFDIYLQRDTLQEHWTILNQIVTNVIVAFATRMSSKSK